MQDDGIRQAGFFALGGTLAAAGGTLFSIGLAVNPRSQILQFLGLIAFVAGLAIIIYAMTGRQTSRSETATSAGSQPKGKAATGDASHRQAITNKTSRFLRSEGVTVAGSLIAIAVGAFVSFGLEGSQANQGTGAVVITDTDAYAGPSSVGYIVVSHIGTNTQVRVICTVYGRPFSSEITNSLWD